MPLDHDGKIRMDCSSPYAMAGLLALRDRFAVAFGNDTDADRHGIVTPTAGLMNPNHYLAVAIEYLFTHRDGWPAGAAVGKTLVSSTLIDRVARALGPRGARGPRRVQVVRARAAGRQPRLRRRGERRAPASCAATARIWTTDKDGIILDLLAAEITAVPARIPAPTTSGCASGSGRRTTRASTRRRRPPRRPRSASWRPRR